MTIAACQTHTDVRIVKAQQKNNRRTKNKKTKTSATTARREEDRRQKKPGGRPKGNTMKNNDTFNQILNSNLASIDPGFGQFALAKASADLMKKVLNK